MPKKEHVWTSLLHRICCLCVFFNSILLHLLCSNQLGDGWLSIACRSQSCLLNCSIDLDAFHPNRICQFFCICYLCVFYFWFDIAVLHVLFTTDDTFIYTPSQAPYETTAAQNTILILIVWSTSSTSYFNYSMMMWFSFICLCYYYLSFHLYFIIH